MFDSDSIPVNSLIGYILEVDLEYPTFLHEYVVHYRNVKYYLSLGMKLVKIHRILSFKQSNWLNVFTDFNTEKRKPSNDEFNKGLYKLFNNCIYEYRVRVLRISGKE